MADGGEGQQAQLIDRIVAHSAAREHLGSFDKPKSGPPQGVQNADDLRAHLADTLNDPATKGFSAKDDGGKMYFYNERTNTIVILDPDSPTGGSVYRPKTPEQGARYFDKLARDSGAALGKMPEVVSGGYKGVTDAFAASHGGVAARLASLVDVDGLRALGRASRGPLVDGIIGITVGGAILAGGGSPAQAASAAGEVVNPVPATTAAIQNGSSAGDVAVAVAQDVSVIGACAAGAVGGAKIGAAGGGAAGTAIPVVGNAAGAAGGAVVGGIVGCAAGAWVASGITDKIINFFKGDDDKVSLNEIKDILPDTVTPDMPPEFAYLVEVQNSDTLLQAALEELKGQGSFDDMAGELEQQGQLYQQAEQQRAVQMNAQQIAPPQYEQQPQRQMTSNFG